MAFAFSPGDEQRSPGGASTWRHCAAVVIFLSALMNSNYPVQSSSEEVGDFSVFVGPCVGWLGSEIHCHAARGCLRCGFALFCVSPPAGALVDEGDDDARGIGVAVFDALDQGCGDCGCLFVNFLADCLAKKAEGVDLLSQLDAIDWNCFRIVGLRLILLNFRICIRLLVCHVSANSVLPPERRGRKSLRNEGALDRLFHSSRNHPSAAEAALVLFNSSARIDHPSD